MKNIQILAFAAVLATTVLSCSKPPEACFYCSPEQVVAGDSVTFNAACTENGSYFNWKFGDGTEDTLVLGEPTIVHFFAAPGTYTVTLTAARKDGVTMKEGNPVATRTISVQ